MLATHLSFPEVGAELFLSPHTIKSQAVSLYRKLGVASRSQAVARARELGLLDGRGPVFSSGLRDDTRPAQHRQAAACHPVKRIDTRRLYGAARCQCLLADLDGCGHKK
jgi:Bacterial regulatory proteins, luxR family